MFAPQETSTLHVKFALEDGSGIVIAVKAYIMKAMVNIGTRLALLLGLCRPIRIPSLKYYLIAVRLRAGIFVPITLMKLA